MPSVYNSLFHLLRQHRSTLYLTGTTIPWLYLCVYQSMNGRTRNKRNKTLFRIKVRISPLVFTCTFAECFNITKYTSSTGIIRIFRNITCYFEHFFQGTLDWALAKVFVVKNQKKWPWGLSGWTSIGRRRRPRETKPKWQRGRGQRPVGRSWSGVAGWWWWDAFGEVMRPWCAWVPSWWGQWRNCLRHRMENCDMNAGSGWSGAGCWQTGKTWWYRTGE